MTSHAYMAYSWSLIVVRNKMYYTQAGGVDLLKAKWRKLSDFLSVECDGVDITPKLKQHKVHSVLFLNVPCFGSGTRYIIFANH